ncbi:MAG: electron-transfer flavoprotein:ubiquinone oxidoreductase [Dehalococcoidales bacterium]|nr:electron-transfer flavoprotein:ubiquinone oxidoreductase [Dehalococcoidales bacterium]
MTGQNRMDVLFVGGGPASLTGAIKLKQLLNQNGRKESVVVIEKADKPGQHNLSGAVFEADVLGGLVPNWRESKDAFITRMLGNKVERDELVFLMGNKLHKVLPGAVVPAAMHHKGDYTLSISEMVNWLGDIARVLGVEIYNGFAARELVMENDAIKGIRLGEKGLNKDGGKQSNYLPGELLEAKVTVLGEGSLGQLAEELVNKCNLNKGKNPQIHSLGVKEIVRLPEQNNFGANRVIHTLGFPNKPDVFGGGTLYSMSKNTVAVALVLGLDWRYCDLDPQREFQIFKSHPFVSKLLEGGETIAYGAKTLPEAGYYAVPGLVADGALIIGDDAGLTNVRKLKGLHYAIKSGILAAEAIYQAIEKNDYSKNSLKAYEDKLSDSFVMKDLQEARNYRQGFTRGGLYLGAPLSLVQNLLPRMATEPDYKSMSKGKLNRKYSGGIDRLTAVSLSGTIHREDEPSHISFSDPAMCQRCKEDYGCHPCIYFCPAEVYKEEGDDIVLSPSNCVHCQTCRTKCPHQAIRWHVPEGGDGPKYKIM